MKSVTCSSIEVNQRVYVLSRLASHTRRGKIEKFDYLCVRPAIVKGISPDGGGKDTGIVDCFVYMDDKERENNGYHQMCRNSIVFADKESAKKSPPPNRNCY